MIRKQMLLALTEVLGEPRENVTHEWWIARRRGKPAVHVCLNAKISAEDATAHLLIFDPSAALGKNVIELRPKSDGDVKEAVALVEQLVAIENTAEE